ncbi:MAG TPA: hypothetical protein VIJ61_13555 [Thermoanaerobaculia bacterium]
MSDVIEETRRLKSRALDARDRGDFGRAIELLGLASRLLSETLQELKGKRDTDSSPGRQETEAASQLCHILGSMGGVHRRNRDYPAAVHAYDAGYDIERPGAEYGIVNSFNLVQRLVTRVFLDPSAVKGEDAKVEGLQVRHELREALKELQPQIEGSRRDDEYAKADLFMVQLLLDDQDWLWTLEDFKDSHPEPYAIKATVETLKDLRDRVASVPSAPPDLARRLSMALAQF